MSLPFVSIFLILDKEFLPDETVVSFLKQNESCTDFNIIELGSKSEKRRYHTFRKMGVKYNLFHEETLTFERLKEYIEKVAGEYVLFLSARDVYTEHFLPRMLSKAKLSDADIIFCNFWVFNDKKQEKEIVDWSLKENFLPEQKVFSAIDCSKTIFNIAPVSIYNKLYKKEFLKKIKYEISEGSENLLAFALETLAVASKISCVSDRLFCYYPQKKSVEIVNNIKKERSLINEFNAVYYFLTRNDIAELFEQSFLNYFIERIYSIANSLKEPMKSFWDRFVFFQLSDYFGIGSKDEDYFYDKKIYKWFFDLRFKENLSFDLEENCISGRKKIVPIVMAINDGYTFYAGVTIQSIKENLSQDSFCDIYIMYTSLSSESIKRLEALSDSVLRVCCVDISSYLSGYTLEDKMHKNLSHISKETYYRLIIPDLVEGYDKVIYLDADLVVCSDLTELYDVDLGNNLLGGCYNPHFWDEEYKYFEQEIKVDPLSYINAGVLLVNARLWREENIKDKCFQILSLHGEPFKYVDQDVLNIACQYRILLLDPKWNLIYSMWQDVSAYKKFVEKKCRRNQFAIYHYTWCIKPWLNPEKEMMDVWWFYARKSPFYEAILYQNFGNNKKDWHN